MAEIIHFTDARQLSPGFLSELFQQMKNGLPESPKGCDRLAYMLFYAPSDITESSFVRAIGHLGWGYHKVLPNQTTWKGDPAEEEHLIGVANLQGYDVVILRSQELGGAQRAARSSAIPIINAGEGFKYDGGNTILHFPQHPTQALADGFTISQELGRLEELKFVITGDLRNNPVANSWLCTFANFPNAEITLATKPFPDGLHRDIEEHLEGRRVQVKRVDYINEVLPEADVLCIAHSNVTNRDRIPTAAEIGQDWLALLHPEAVIVHDLIRGIVPDVAKEVIGDRRFIHQQQIKNGVLARGALLRRMTGS